MKWDIESVPIVLTDLRDMYFNIKKIYHPIILNNYYSLLPHILCQYSDLLGPINYRFCYISLDLFSIGYHKVT